MVRAGKVAVDVTGECASLRVMVVRPALMSRLADVPVGCGDHGLLSREHWAALLWTCLTALRVAFSGLRYSRPVHRDPAALTREEVTLGGWRSNA